MADEATLAEAWPVIANTEVLAISQSYNGHPGRLILNSSDYLVKHCALWASGMGGHNCTLPTWQVWAKKMAAGAVAMLAVNVGDDSVALNVSLPLLGFDEKVFVRDLWAHSDNGTASGELNTGPLIPHSCVFILLTPVASAASALSD